MSTPALKKPRKIDQAVAILTRFQDQRTALTKKEFRTLCVDAIKKELDVSNLGTIGMYFADADIIVTGRAPKLYNSTSGTRKANKVKTPKVAAAKPNPNKGTASEDQLNKLASTFAAAVKKIQGKSTKETVAPLVASL